MFQAEGLQENQFRLETGRSETGEDGRSGQDTTDALHCQWQRHLMSCKMQLVIMPIMITDAATRDSDLAIHRLDSRDRHEISWVYPASDSKGLHFADRARVQRAFSCLRQRHPAGVAAGRIMIRTAQSVDQ